MPNWCDCFLEITANNLNEIQTFYNENKTDNLELSFNIKVPIPEDQEENWYSWRVSNWGTKWDLSDETMCEMDEDNNYISYGFSTAWSPLIEWMNSVSNQYPNLTFKIEYSEPGCSFAGVLILKNEEVIEEIQYESYSYYQWIKNKDEIINSIYNFSKDSSIDEFKDELEKEKNKIMELFKYFLPEVIQHLILNFYKKDLEKGIVKEYISSNKEEINELLEEYYIYDEDILDNYIISEMFN